MMEWDIDWQMQMMSIAITLLSFLVAIVIVAVGYMGVVYMRGLLKQADFLTKEIDELWLELEKQKHHSGKPTKKSTTR